MHAATGEMAPCSYYVEPSSPQGLCCPLMYTEQLYPAQRCWADSSARHNKAIAGQGQAPLLCCACRLAPPLTVRACLCRCLPVPPSAAAPCRVWGKQQVSRACHAYSPFLGSAHSCSNAVCCLRISAFNIILTKPPSRSLYMSMAKGLCVLRRHPQLYLGGHRALAMLMDRCPGLPSEVSCRPLT